MDHIDPRGGQCGDYNSLHGVLMATQQPLLNLYSQKLEKTVHPVLVEALLKYFLCRLASRMVQAWHIDDVCRGVAAYRHTSRGVDIASQMNFYPNITGNTSGNIHFKPEYSQ